MKWLILIAVVAFIAAQITRLRPSARDGQLQRLRKKAAEEGLLVRFWSSRNSGYIARGLPETGFSYSLPWPHADTAFTRWAVWLGVEGDKKILAGKPPDVALEWLDAFQKQFPAGWALLESTESGLAVLWQERGNEKNIEDLSAALRLLSKSI